MSIISGDKKHRSYLANMWLCELNSTYRDVTEKAKAGTVVVMNDGNELKSECKYGVTRINTLSVDVASCAAEVVKANLDKTVCILNFASCVRPGGGFLNGAVAQEEALCHVTGLYPCLSQPQCAIYYKEARKEDSLYRSYIYTHDCPLIVDGSVWLVDVLTMAAVNRNIAYKDPDKLMNACQETAYTVPASYGADILVLGAWGCGVFKNRPEDVARQWKYLQSKYDGLYHSVYHPVIGPSYYKFSREMFL